MHDACCAPRTTKKYLEGLHRSSQQCMNGKKPAYTVRRMNPCAVGKPFILLSPPVTGLHHTIHVTTMRTLVTATGRQAQDTNPAMKSLSTRVAKSEMEARVACNRKKLEGTETADKQGDKGCVHWRGGG